MNAKPPALLQLEAMREQVAAGRVEAPSPAFAAYLDKVRHHAYKITDEEVAALLAAGLTQEQIYEATMYTAMTAGIDRFAIGLAAWRGAE